MIPNEHKTKYTQNFEQASRTDTSIETTNTFYHLFEFHHSCGILSISKYGEPFPPYHKKYVLEQKKKKIFSEAVNNKSHTQY